MIAQPQSFNCEVLIEQITSDPQIPGKQHIEGKILVTKDVNEDNTFFAKGRSITGFAFNLPESIKSGMTVKADVEFIGDPFKQNYQLSNVEPAG